MRRDEPLEQVVAENIYEGRRTPANPMAARSDNALPGPRR
jgi:hypothetical protein